MHIIALIEPTTLRYSLSICGPRWDFFVSDVIRIKPLKEPKDYEGQVQNLIDKHGLRIDDLCRAKDILSRVNYYRLSAYGIGLKQKDDREKYLEGTSLETLYRLYCFDSHLRYLLTPLIERLEIELRTRIAYHLALTYGSEGYCDENNFIKKYSSNNEDIYLKTIQRFQNEVKMQRNLPCVKHHQTEYGGHFPVWAAVELFSFGMLSSLYSVMQPKDRKTIAHIYKTNADHLQSWMLALVEVRNICAHYGRIYNMPLKQSPYLYVENQRYACNKVFPLLLTIKHMMTEASSWNTFFFSLCALTEEYPEANIKYMGFPDEWKDLLE